MRDFGTYTSVNVLNPSAARVYEYIHKNGIPQDSPEDRNALHATLLWSKTTIASFEPNADLIHHAVVKDLHVFNSNGLKRLAFLIKSPTLAWRHAEIIQRYGAVSRYAEFVPHITIAYDIGNFEWWKLPSFKYNVLLGNENAKIGNDRKTITKRPKWTKVQEILSGIG